MQAINASDQSGKQQRAIHVTLVLLPSGRKKEITIPMNNAPTAVVALSRVHFTCLGRGPNIQSPALPRPGAYKCR